MSRLDNRQTIRSFRGVLDHPERRIFKIDRWRIPKPDGLSVRGLVYTVGALIAVLFVGNLPIVGTMFAAIPPSVRLVAIPIGVGWALASWAPDGRAPHHALISAVRFLRAPRHLAAFRRCPPIGANLLGVAEVQMAAGIDEAAYRPGVIQGPARVTMRYPAGVSAAGTPRRMRDGGAQELAHARRIVVEPLEGARKPLARGKTLTVPAGKQLVIR